jgi:hypothetical protein
MSFNSWILLSSLIGQRTTLINSPRTGRVLKQDYIHHRLFREQSQILLSDSAEKCVSLHGIAEAKELVNTCGHIVICRQVLFFIKIR